MTNEDYFKQVDNIIRFAFSYFGQDITKRIFNKKCGFKDQNSFHNAILANPNSFNKKNELNRFITVFFSELLGKEFYKKHVKNYKNVGFQDPESANQFIEKKFPEHSVQYLFCINALKTALDAASIGIIFQEYYRQYLRILDYVLKVLSGRCDFKKLQRDEALKIIDINDKPSDEESDRLKEDLDKSNQLINTLFHGFNVNWYKIGMVIRAETSFDEAINKIKPQAVDENKAKTPDDTTAESLEKSLVQDNRTLDLTLQTLTDQIHHASDAADAPQSPTQPEEPEIDFKQKLEIRDVRIPLSMAKCDSKRVQLKCYSGYVTVYKSTSSTFRNFYPMLEWDGEEPRSLGNYQKRKIFFPDCANICFADAVVSSNSQILKQGCLLNVYYSNISDNMIAGSKTQTAITKEDLNDSIDTPLIKADADTTSHRLLYVFTLDKNKNERIDTLKFTYLKLNEHDTLPALLSGISGTDIVIFDSGTFFGPYRLKTNGQGAMYVDLRTEQYGKEGLLRCINIRKGCRDKAKLNFEIYSDEDRSSENFEILLLTKEYCELSLIDSYQGSDLIKMLSNRTFKHTDPLGFKTTDQEELLGSELTTAYDEINSIRAKKIINIFIDQLNKERLDEQTAFYIAKLIPKLAQNHPSQFKAVYDALLNDQDALERMSSHRELVQKIRILNREIENKKNNEEALNRKLNDIKTKLSEKEAELFSLDAEFEKKKNQLTLQCEHELKDLRERIKHANARLQKIAEDKKRQIEDFKDFDRSLENTVRKVSDLAFDNVITSKIMEAASNLNQKQKDAVSEQKIRVLNALHLEEFKNSQNLAEELVKRLRLFRNYDYNDCIDILITLSQNFITIFSGTPGIGKTSLCEILAKTLGLCDLERQIKENPWSKHEYANRYIPVSVEKGWTSKRDLIGYYNPLTKKFESPDPHRYECFKDLDAEFRADFKRLPYLILLDEANLSPMEYYFADFMNICDERSSGGFISLGDGENLRIPDTLRFVATINNDQTTEMLSPRMIDRAPVIVLPEIDDWLESDDHSAEAAEYKPISWTDFQDVFAGTASSQDLELKNKLRSFFDEIAKAGFRISPRVKKAVLKFVRSAQKLMHPDSNQNAFEVSLDYAVSQRILPHISGSGDEYQAMLNNLLELFNASKLLKSSDLLNKIIAEGDHNMNYYRFF